MSQIRSQLGGSTISFIFVGVLLVLIIIGGLYALRSRTDNKVARSSSSPTPVVSVQKKMSSSTSSKTSGTAPKDTNSSPTHTAKRSGSADRSLPETGPAQDMLSIVGLPILVGVAVAYMQSRMSGLALRLR